LKLPRDLSGADVIRALERAGFTVLRQKGSHIRMARGSTRVTIPNHPAIALGTLRSILGQAGIDAETLIRELL